MVPRQGCGTLRLPWRVAQAVSQPHLQLVQTEFTVLPAGALAIGQDPAAAHHDGA